MINFRELHRVHQDYVDARAEHRKTDTAESFQAYEHAQAVWVGQRVAHSAQELIESAYVQIASLEDMLHAAAEVIPPGNARDAINGYFQQTLEGVG